MQILSNVLLPCDLEGLDAHCANRIISYYLEKMRGPGVQSRREQIEKSHPLFGPASEILWDKVKGMRSVEWKCEVVDVNKFRYHIFVWIYLPTSWERLGEDQNAGKFHRITYASREFKHEEELWITVERKWPKSGGWTD